MSEGLKHRLAKIGLDRIGLSKRALIALPSLWLTVFFLVPFLIVVKISLSESRVGIPPYTDLLQLTKEASLWIKINFGNYIFLFEDDLYFKAYLNSLKIASVATMICLLIGYPIAYALTKLPTFWRNVSLLLVILPFWTSFLIRVYAWVGLLKSDGPINSLLINLGIIDQPLTLLYTSFSVYVGIVYSYLPFMILPLYATLEKMDKSLIEAALDLGCSPFKAFVKVTLPLSLPGIIAGSMLVFIPAVGEFVIPDLLGGSNILMIGKVLWNEFFLNRDWPMASAVASLILLVLVLPIMYFQKAQEEKLPDAKGGN